MHFAPAGESMISGGNNTTLFLNRTTGDGSILDFRKNGGQVGSIGTTAGNLWVAGATNGIRLAGGTFNATNASGTVATGAVDLGYSNGKWKDLYLSGNANIGGNINNFVATNSGNPEFSIGSSATNRLLIQSVYNSGAQVLNYVSFRTSTTSSNANAGKMFFGVDEADKLEINDGGIAVTGSIRPTSHLYLPDTAAAVFGTGEDLEIYHDASDSYIKESGTGNLLIQGSDIYMGNTSSNHAFVIRNSGNVGIGTTSPLSPLEVSESFAGAAGSTKLRITSKHAGSYIGQAHIDFAYNDYGNVNVPNITASIQALSSVTSATNVGGELLFATKALGGSTTTAPVEHMRIQSDGFVNIGGTSHSYSVDTQGYMAGIQSGPNATQSFLSIARHGKNLGSQDLIVGHDGDGAYFWTRENANIFLGAGNVERVRIYGTGSTAGNMHIMDGNLSVAAGHGIDFSASSNVSTMNGELLDDYEEGTWTPSIVGATSASGQTYSIRTGSYVKIGRSVTANFSIVLTAKGNMAGSIKIVGLPFNGISGRSQAATIISGSMDLDDNQQLVGYQYAVNPLIYLFYQENDTALVQLSGVGAINNNTEIQGSVTYFTDA
jgi:hypothetical protein